jgi:soluble lytic murein transglycosylase-like protein
MGGERPRMPEFGHTGARRLQQSGCLSVAIAPFTAQQGPLMKSLVSFAWLVAIAALPLSQGALARDAQYDALVATHAKANNLPEALVHRVIVRESGYRPHLVSHGNIGLMQIKLGTARGLGYTGTAEGLRDPETNLTWAVKYLAGAYRAANGDHKRAIHYYASGYYFAAKRQHRHQARPGWKN